MAGFINAISIASGAATFISLGLAFIEPPDPSDGNSIVKIQVGLDSADTGLNGAGGDMPIINGYNNAGEKIGDNNLAPGNSIGNGASTTTQIGQGDSNGQQVVSIDVNAGDDGICIASIVVTWEDGQSRAWLGDTGQGCDQRWYPSKIIVNDDNYEPACTWLDKDHTDGTKSSSMYLHFPDFYVADGGAIENEDPAYYCSRPAMEFANDGGDAKKNKRDLRPKPANDTRLVVHESKRWTAREVCEDPNSYGPDYVSLKDGLFCNMETRELIPLCSDTVTEDCFSLDDQPAAAAGAKARRRRNVLTKRGYSKVLDWTRKGE